MLMKEFQVIHQRKPNIQIFQLRLIILDKVIKIWLQSKRKELT